MVSGPIAAFLEREVWLEVPDDERGRHAANFELWELPHLRRGPIGPGAPMVTQAYTIKI